MWWLNEHRFLDPTIDVQLPQLLVARFSYLKFNKINQVTITNPIKCSRIPFNYLSFFYRLTQTIHTLHRLKRLHVVAYDFHRPCANDNTVFVPRIRDRSTMHFSLKLSLGSPYRAVAAVDHRNFRPKFVLCTCKFELSDFWKIPVIELQIIYLSFCK